MTIFGPEPGSFNDPPTADEASRNGHAKPRFATRPADSSRMRPVEFIWSPWLVRGRLNLMVGEEKVGKSTLSAYIAAAITNGTLPGAFEGRPADVLFVGADEDDWNSVTLPRLYAAGADFERVHEFYALNETSMFNVEDHAAELVRLLAEHEFSLVFFEHLMDVLPRMSNYNEPAAMRRALKPLRRALAACDVAGLATLHVNKMQAQAFRQRSQGSVQLGAMARSSFLVDRHPKDPNRRVAVLAPVNYVRDDLSHALAFRVESYLFSCNGELFNVGQVVDVAEDDVTMADVLRSERSERERERDERVQAVLDALSEEPLSGRAIARLAEVPEPTVRRILRELEAEGEAARHPGGGWVRHCVSSLRDDAVTHPSNKEATPDEYEENR